MRLPRYYHFFPAALCVPKQYVLSSVKGKCFKEVVDPYQDLPSAEETDLNHILAVGGSLEQRPTNYIQSVIDVTPIFKVVSEEN